MERGRPRCLCLFCPLYNLCCFPYLAPDSSIWSLLIYYYLSSYLHLSILILGINVGF